MATSDNEFEADLEEQAKSLTTCSICMDQFSSPKVLPCQHTFCLTCLKRCYESINSQRLVKISNFPCPSCRKVCYVPPGGMEQLASDFRIGQILDLMAAIESSSQHQQRNKTTTVPGFGRCSICCFQKREKPASSFCLQCEKAFCSQCLSHHAKTKIFRDHEVVNDNQTTDENKQNPLKCNEHDVHFKYFCEDCSKLLCTVCLFSEHEDHSVLEKEKAANDLHSKLNKFAEDLSGEVSKSNGLNATISNLKKSILSRKEKLEAQVCSAYEESLKTIEQSKMQLFVNAKLAFDNSLNELENIEKSIANHHSLFQSQYDSVMAAKTQKESWKLFTDFKLIKESIASLPPIVFETLNLDLPKFSPSHNISLGSITKTKKTYDLNKIVDLSANECDDSKEKPSINNENEEVPQIPQNKLTSAVQLLLSVHCSDNKNFNNYSKKDILKPNSSDKVIQGLGRRLSGRLSMANLHQMSLAGATALSPKKKIRWIAEGFSQCRGCCFFKISQQWVVAACDFRATNAGDRIKIFDLKGRQQSVINVRAIVEPWSLCYQATSHSLMVSDVSNRAVKMIHLDENGCCSKVTTMYQSFSDRPAGICATNSGSFVVTDVGHRQNRISVYAMGRFNLEKRKEFGKSGNKDGEINCANYVAVDNNNRVIVSDTDAHNIKVFSLEDGSQLLKFSCSCSFDGGREMVPQGVAVDDSNNILVADQATNSVVMFSSEGQLISSLVYCKGKPWGIAYMDELRILAVATDKGLEVFEL